VRTLTQFRASFSGANSSLGKDGWFRRINRRLVTARMSVSRFSNAASLVLRISAGENRLKMSSVVSGSSQNCRHTVSLNARIASRLVLTDAQYGSSAGMSLSSDSLKIPCLNTSFESDAPIVMCALHLTILSWEVWW
jgi:hypothetical protein